MQWNIFNIFMKKLNIMKLKKSSNKKVYNEMTRIQCSLILKILFLASFSA